MFAVFDLIYRLRYKKNVLSYINNNFSSSITENKFITQKSDLPIDCEPLLLLLQKALIDKNPDVLRGHIACDAEYMSDSNSGTYIGEEKIIDKFCEIASKTTCYPSLVSIIKHSKNKSLYLKGTLCLALAYSEHGEYETLAFIDVNSEGFIKHLYFTNDEEYKFNIYGESRESVFSLKRGLNIHLNLNSDHGEIRYALPLEDTYNPEETKKVINYSLSESNLSALLSKLDKNTNATFVDVVIHYIDLKKVKDSEVYKAAQIDRRLFSKMICNRNYSPAKDTVIAIAFALKLSLEETIDLLSRAGYTLSHSNKRDIIIEYFIREKVSNLNIINGMLYNLNQKIIGR